MGSNKKFQFAVFVFAILVTVFHAGIAFAQADKPVGRYAIPATPCDPLTDFREVFLVRDWDLLPHKNQEETVEQCNEINSKIGKEVWKYSRRFPVWSCLAFAAASIADWWAIELGLPLENYRNFYNGHQEKGFNPRVLEAEYANRSEADPKKYFRAPLRDPIMKTRIPLDIRGYGEILVRPDKKPVPDPSATSFLHNPLSASPMDGEWLSLFYMNVGFDHTDKLVEALRKYGPVYVHLDFAPYSTLLPGGHSVLVIGYGRPKKNPEKIYMIIHDSYGDYPKDYAPSTTGGPSYRYLRARWIDSAMVFPHSITVQSATEESGIRLSFLNSGKKPVPINFLRISKTSFEKKFSDGKTTSVLIPGKILKSFPKTGWIEGEVEADYYFKSDGKGRSFKIKFP